MSASPASEDALRLEVFRHALTGIAQAMDAGHTGQPGTIGFIDVLALRACLFHVLQLQ